MEKVTWGKLIDMDRDIELLFIRAILYGQKQRTDQQLNFARKKFREEIFFLVGNGCHGDPFLKSSEGWELVKEKIFRALEGGYYYPEEYYGP